MTKQAIDQSQVLNLDDARCLQDRYIALGIDIPKVNYYWVHELTVKNIADNTDPQWVLKTAKQAKRYKTSSMEERKRAIIPAYTKDELCLILCSIYDSVLERETAK